MRLNRQFFSTSLATAILLTVVPAHASAQEAQAPVSSSWSHDLSGLVLPASLAGLTRGESRQFDDNGNNVTVSFHEEASGTVADLYVYRAAPASVQIWADRAASSMFANSKLGNVDVAAVKVFVFTPPNGAGENSGLQVIAPVKGELTASGLAIYAHDGWLVKLRMSSSSLDAASLEARMAEFVAGMKLPVAVRPAPQLVDIADCQTPLKSDKNAKLVRLDMMGTILLGGVIGVANDKRTEKSESRAADLAVDPAWCRDAASRSEYGVYRRGNEDDAYLVAVSDSGTSLTIGRYNMAGLMKPSRGFLVTQSDGVTELVYPPFDRMPQPEQVIGLPGNVSPVSSVSLSPVDGKRKQTIMVPSK